MSIPKPPPGHFTLLYFAAATSFTRRSHDFFPAPLSLSQLYDAVEKKYPGMREKVLSSSALTVNLEYVDVEEEAQKGEKGIVIQAGDEVAIIPPAAHAALPIEALSRFNEVIEAANGYYRRRSGMTTTRWPKIPCLHESDEGSVARPTLQAARQRVSRPSPRVVARSA
ncbi:hypothetical protein LTR74_006591 [Friedmanniomyces endolithicus]|nr:hypothetical protein LTR74_006591 [Friedmanniomyces endolithicus]